MNSTMIYYQFREYFGISNNENQMASSKLELSQFGWPDTRRDYCIGESDTLTSSEIFVFKDTYATNASYNTDIAFTET